MANPTPRTFGKSSPNASPPSSTPDFDIHVPAPSSRPSSRHTTQFFEPPQTPLDGTPTRLRKEKSAYDSSHAPGIFASAPRRSSSPMSAYSWWRVKRLATRPLPWLLLILIGMLTWWSAGARRELQSPDVQSRLRELFPPEFTRDLKFYPANNHKIHYVGRWASAPNRLRIDGSFPGVYFDLNITNTSSLVLSLQNAKADLSKPLPLEDTELKGGDIPAPGSQYSQYSFTAASRLRVSAPPISLLALVDDEEYVVLPNATSLVPVRMKDLDARLTHSVRVIAPMTDDDGVGVVQLDGIWLDKGGQLLPVEGSSAQGEDSDDFDPESEEIGKLHRMGLSKILNRFSGDQVRKTDEEEADPGVADYRKRRRLIEIVTDIPAHLNHKPRASSRTSASDTLLAGVMGWEYLLGEMFSVDHVCIGSEGMCLTHDCIGGTGSPSGMGDTFFRSGPARSPHFGHPWPFQSYVPDVMILNLGASDYYSYEMNAGEYNKSSAEYFATFEDTYVSLVKAIRNLAYPNHPSIIEMERLGLDTHIDNDAPASIPIFIMRPFMGEFEHATQGAVSRLRNEGDKGVFWLDTTGWLDIEDTETTSSDFFTDPDEPMGHPHLTQRGNQKVAIYLHTHVCRYLAAEDEKCAFLPPEVYQGQVFDPSVATLDRYIETEKERQMKEIYFEDEKDL